MAGATIEKLKAFNQKILPIRQVLWIVLGGWALALFYLLGAVGLVLSIFGIPLVPECIKLARFGFCPVGYTYMKKADAHRTLDFVANIVWCILLGWEFALMHLGFAIVNALTIFGIGNAIQHVRMIPLALFPFGKQVFVKEAKTIVVNPHNQASSMV